MSKLLFNRYIWLVDTLDRAGRLAFEDIDTRWQHATSLNPEGEPMPRRTFHNHRQAIEEMFDISIECERTAPFRYYIEDTSRLRDSRAREWMLSSFALNNALNERTELSQRILLEEVPSGRKYLTPLLDAMNDGVRVRITYRSYRRNDETTFEIEPYCLKMFRQRWYLLGRNPYFDTLRVYALDRIHALEHASTRFCYPDAFDAGTFFSECFGVTYSPDEEPEEIVVRAFGIKADYLRSLPLHSTQREIGSASSSADFRLRVRPSYEFIHELLSHGSEIKVMSPPWLADAIRNEALRTAENYLKSI